jgi:hypothetical protein
MSSRRKRPRCSNRETSFVGEEQKMRKTKEYWAAFERLKRIKPVPEFDASKRMTREQAHERR